MTTDRCTKLTVLALFLLAILAASFALAADAPKPAPAKATPYPLTTCLVSDEKLGGPEEPPVSLVHDGQEFRFCCKKCIKKFNEDPAKYHALLQQEIVKAGKASYPLDTCVVSGEKLDQDAYDYVYQGQLVRFCCKKCVKEFDADPAKFLSKIDAARKSPKG